LGCRWTRPRQEVLEVFRQNPKPITVQDAFDKLGGRRTDLASVYRTVNLFVKHGVAVAVDTVGDSRRYELSDAYREHHHHVICQVCGRVEDIVNCALAKLEEQVSKLTHFKILHHDLKFVGLCGECR
jgi:Fur family ferric uptake transcriptional regulator